MRFFNLTLLAIVALWRSSIALGNDDWPPQEFTGAWLVTNSSADGERIDEAKDNILIFHKSKMIFATDRNYAPPNPEVAATGYEFYAIKTTGPKTIGLIRVQRGKLKFMLTRKLMEDVESIEVTIEDYAENRVHELVRMSANRMDLQIARDRIQRLLADAKLKSSAEFQQTLQDWLATNKTGQPSKTIE